MRPRTLSAGASVLIGLCAVTALRSPAAASDTSGAAARARLLPKLAKYVSARAAEFEQIDAERRSLLDTLATHIADRLRAETPVRVTFVCTHNSRRSHFAQLWALVAARHAGIDRVQTYSGGTEATACNPRTVAALERAGFDVERTTDDDNPIYHVRFAANAPAATCFSKVYDHAPNPKHDFIVVMTCSHADETCPSVRGAALRLAITYDDPKAADDTPEEASRYDERCAQIAREMLYVFNEVARAPGMNKSRPTTQD